MGGWFQRCPLGGSNPRHRKGGGGVAHRKSSLLPMSGVHNMAHSNLKIEGNFWYEGGLQNLSASIFLAANFFLAWYATVGP